MLAKDEAAVLDEQVLSKRAATCSHCDNETVLNDVAVGVAILTMKVVETGVATVSV